jgi:hydroxyethylthiazole kinase-like uncharacterized protein yjeF
VGKFPKQKVYILNRNINTWRLTPNKPTAIFLLHNMLPLLTSAQIREADAYTIAHEPISSINLMERASKAFVSWFVNHFPDKKSGISVYCGTGNNGGDGLTIARLLYDHHYEYINVKLVRFSEKESEDFKENLQRLKLLPVNVTDLVPGNSITEETSDIIIDAILGSGLNKPLSGSYRDLVDHLNRLHKTVVAVDVPTGFYADGEVDKEAIVLNQFPAARIRFFY